MKKFQTNYGSFNAKYLGILLRFPTSHPDSFSFLLSALLRSEKHQLSGDSERDFHDLSLLTALEHEARHFHDQLLCPLGSLLVRLRILALFNVINTLPGPAAAPVLPLPLSRWVAMTKEEKIMQMRAWSIFLPAGAMPPDFSKEDAELVALAATYCNQTVSFMASDRLPTIQLTHLLEASAILAQRQAIVARFDAASASQFFMAASNGLMKPGYTKVVNMLVKLFEVNSQTPDFDLINAIVTWSLMGDSVAPGDDNYPTIRFAKLFHYLNSYGLPAGDWQVEELFNQWDQAFGYEAVLEGLRRTRDKNTVLVEELHNTDAESDALFTETRNRCLLAAETLRHANAEMVGHFEKDPDSYVRLSRYVGNSDLPVPAVRCEFIGGGGIPAKFLAGTSCKIWKSIQNEKGEMITAVTLSGGDLIRTEDAENVEVVLDFTDFLLSESNRSNPAFDDYRRQLLQIGMRCMDLPDD